jgi:protein-L-isoaspartate(D-aspartate) O-methyltransferase
MTFEKARFSMVESQLRPNGVRDPLILNAFASLPREYFVPEGQQSMAYRDEAVQVIPAKAGAPARYILPPMVLARMLQFAAPKPSDRVLDIGGATGYSAAVVKRLCRHVEVLEESEAATGETKRCLEKAGVSDIEVHTGPLATGLPASEPFDLILIAGAFAEEPKALFGQLAERGRLAGIMRKGWFGQAWLFSKNEGAVSGRAIFDAGAEILPGFEEKPEFVF